MFLALSLMVFVAPSSVALEYEDDYQKYYLTQAEIDAWYAYGSPYLSYLMNHGYPYNEALAMTIAYCENYYGYNAFGASEGDRKSNVSTEYPATITEYVALYVNNATSPDITPDTGQGDSTTEGGVFMSDFLTDVGLVFTASTGWMVDIIDIVMDTPLLLTSAVIGFSFSFVALYKKLKG